MSKSEKLKVEAIVRDAINERFKSNSINSRQPVAENGHIHEFDIYESGLIIGGVSTGTKVTSGGSSNTGSKDRAAAELLWLSLWQGHEKRVHVLTSKDLAEWLFNRFNGATFPFKITILHFDTETKELGEIGTLGI